MKRNATEITGNDLIARSKQAEGYKKEVGNRFTNRVSVNIQQGDSMWQEIDMSKLFNTDNLQIPVPIQGSRGDIYRVDIVIKGVRQAIKDTIEQKGLDQQAIITTLTKAIDNNDLEVGCTCKDFQMRLASYLTAENSTTSKHAVSKAPVKTNPNDSFGRGCKHIIFCIYNKQWLTRTVNSIISYIKTIYRINKTLFSSVITAKLGVTPAMLKPNYTPSSNIPSSISQGQPPQQPTQQSLQTDSDIVDAILGGDTANEGLRGRGSKGTIRQSMEGFYDWATSYDSMQNLMIDEANRQNIPIQQYVTPKNSPSQIALLSALFKKYPNLTEDNKQELCNPLLTLQQLEVLGRAIGEGIDLFDYSDRQSSVLQQFYRAVKKGLPLEMFEKRGYNSNQIALLVKAYQEDIDLYKELVSGNYNYYGMLQKIKEYNANKNTIVPPTV